MRIFDHSNGDANRQMPLSEAQKNVVGIFNAIVPGKSGYIAVVAEDRLSFAFNDFNDDQDPAATRLVNELKKAFSLSDDEIFMPEEYLEVLSQSRPVVVRLSVEDLDQRASAQQPKFLSI